MQRIYFRLKTRKKQIINIICILTILLTASFLTFFLPQIANPQILGKYFDNFASSLYLDDMITDVGIKHYQNDVEFSGSANSVEFIEDFTSVLQSISTGIYGLFETLSHDLLCVENVLFNNTDHTVLLGINRKRYDEILTINQNETSYYEAIVITSRI
ncbi:hypothetical protein EU534_02535, partial [Candidatus Heimdallarchaeota archaeon]